MKNKKQMINRILNQVVKDLWKGRDIKIINSDLKEQYDYINYESGEYYIDESWNQLDYNIEFKLDKDNYIIKQNENKN